MGERRLSADASVRPTAQPRKTLFRLPPFSLQLSRDHAPRQNSRRFSLPPFRPVSAKLILLFILAVASSRYPLLPLSSLPLASAQTCTYLTSSTYGLAPLPEKRDYPGSDLEYIEGPISSEECQRRCLSYDGGQCILAVVSDAGECSLKSGVNRQPVRSASARAFAMPCFSSSCVNTSEEGSALCATCPTDFTDPNKPTASFKCSDSTSMGFISPVNSSWELSGELVPDNATINDIDATECVRRCQSYPGPCVTAQYVPGMQLCVLKKEYGSPLDGKTPGFLAFVKKCAVSNGGCGQSLCQQGQPNTCIDPKEYGFRFKDKDTDYTGPEVGGGEGLDSAGCVERCQKNDKCTLAQMDPKRLKCWLKGYGYNSHGSQQPGRINFERIEKGARGRLVGGFGSVLVAGLMVMVMLVIL